MTALAVLGSCLAAHAAVLAPTNPNASPKAKAIYTYLQNIKGQGILSGQESMLWDNSSAGNTNYSAAYPYSFRDQFVAGKNGGKYPAIYESDFGDVETTVSGLGARSRIVSILKARAPKGAIFMLNWHTSNAATQDGDGYGGAKTLTNSKAIIDSMLKEGTAYNVEWLKRIDLIAGYLKELRDSNIVVMWRPFHENNGNFFWWGQQPRFAELWKQMYDRYTKVHGLDNLLWVYNSNHFGSNDTWVRKNYPGDAYVDVMSVDVYHPYYNFEKTMYDTLMAIGKGKPVGISENGRMPDVPKLFAEGQHYVFWVTWWGFEGADRTDGLSGNPDSLYTRNYSSAYTITEDEIKLDVKPDGKKTVGATASAGGSVTVSPTGRVDSNTVVTFKAVAEAGYEFSGWSGDTTVPASVNPLKVTVTRDRSIKALFTPGAATNLLKDGNFTTSSNWGFYVHPNNTATVGYGTGAAVVNITAAQDTNWKIQLSQSALELEKGVTYVLSFTVSASSARTLNAGFSSGAPDWLGLGNADFEVGTTPQLVSVEIKASGTASAAILQLNIGGKTGTVTIDNASLVRKSGGGTGIAASARLNSGSPLAVELHGASLAWSAPSALASSGTLRLLDAQGRELTRASVAAGTRSGSLEMVGQGLRFVVLESAQGSLRAMVPAVR
jgi:mannan endo-1,4-beta-mannosidase